MSSYNALYPPNVGAQSAVHIHITDREYNTQYMLIADTFTVHRETGKQNSKPAPVPECGDTPFPSMWDLHPTSTSVMSRPFQGSGAFNPTYGEMTD